MMRHLLYALLIALSGVELRFLLKRSHALSPEDERLIEASEYTIVDVTPKKQS